MAKQTFTTGQVLTAAQMTSLQETAMGGGPATAKTASYVLVAADAGTVVRMNAAGATTITVNTSLFAAGDTVYIQNIGAGVCTITAGTATVNTSSSLALAQYEGGTLYFTAASASLFFKAAGAAAAAGGMTLISETVASANSSISFTGISGTYKQLVLAWSGILYSAATSEFSLRFNNDSGTNYHSAGLRVSNTTVRVEGEAKTSLTSTAGGVEIYSFGRRSNVAAMSYASSGYVTIDNYASSTKAKVINANFAYYDGTAGDAKTANCVFTWDNTSAITSLDIVRLSGTDTISNIANTTIRLYGVS